MNKHYNPISKDILDDLNSGETYPATEILKRSIIDAMIRVGRKEADLTRNTKINNGYINPMYKIDFSISIIYLWNLIKGMARQKGIYSRYSENVKGSSPKGSDYDLITILEYDKRELSINELRDLKNYCEDILHKLKITNLLIETNLDIEKELKEEY
jgi:hypothetical protein